MGRVIGIEGYRYVYYRRGTTPRRSYSSTVRRSWQVTPWVFGSASARDEPVCVCFHTPKLDHITLVLYLKTSRKRRTPWRFVFHRAHQEELDALRASYGNVYLGFICGDDGVASIDFRTLKSLLNDKFEDQETVTVRRNPGEMYRLTGSDGSLKNAVSRSGFPIDIVENIKAAFG
jgi:hypothetical protein